MSLPSSFLLSTNNNNLVIKKRWFTLSIITLMALLFCLSLDGSIIYLYVICRFHPYDMLGVIATLCHIIFGIFISYVTAAECVNITEIRVNTTTVSVHHYPLPWLAKDVTATDIDQIICEKRKTYSRYETIITYAVVARLKNGEHDSQINSSKQITLLSTLQKYDQAMFLVEQIERRRLS